MNADHRVQRCSGLCGAHAASSSHPHRGPHAARPGARFKAVFMPACADPRGRVQRTLRVAGEGRRRTPQSLALPRRRGFPLYRQCSPPAAELVSTCNIGDHLFV